MAPIPDGHPGSLSSRGAGPVHPNCATVPNFSDLTAHPGGMGQREPAMAPEGQHHLP